MSKYIGNDPYSDIGVLMGQPDGVATLDVNGEVQEKPVGAASAASGTVFRQDGSWVKAEGIEATKSLTYSGYTKLPGGLIIQWGWSSGGTEPVGVTFPIAFPNAVFAIIPSGHTADQSTPNYVSSYSSTGFEVTRSGTATSVVGFWWIAIGY